MALVDHTIGLFGTANRRLNQVSIIAQLGAIIKVICH
jgi:hypothetical protein